MEPNEKELEQSESNQLGHVGRMKTFDTQNNFLNVGPLKP
jgi:hypothetical protein